LQIDINMYRCYVATSHSEKGRRVRKTNGQ
jgi:hypothetical protein